MEILITQLNRDKKTMIKSFNNKRRINLNNYYNSCATLNTKTMKILSILSLSLFFIQVIIFSIHVNDFYSFLEEHNIYLNDTMKSTVDFVAYLLFLLPTLIIVLDNPLYKVQQLLVRKNNPKITISDMNNKML